MVVIQPKRDRVPDLCAPKFDFLVMESVKNAVALRRMTYTYLNHLSRLEQCFKGAIEIKSCIKGSHC